MTGGVSYALLLLSIPCAPLLLACSLLLWSRKSIPILLAPWAGAPALFASLIPSPTSAVHVPWLLLGTDLGIDRTAQVFLFFTGLLWLTAGVFTTGYLEGGRSRSRFFAYFLFAMAGNLGLIVAQDMLSFYMFFALMSFAAYGLVVHDCTAEARRAGRIYIVMVVAGEALLFAAMALAADVSGSITFDDVRPAIAESSTRSLILAFALSGFGIKLGVLGLHVWLPLAHPVAPTPASAVLSGAMIKAGLLGWLRLLPLGEVALPGWGAALMATGLAATFYGVVVGVSQQNPKTVLAYSSVSQMGLLTASVGLALIAPSRWPEILTVVLLLALHHAVAKSALFLGVGISATRLAENWRRWLVATGLSLPALALVGAPFTSGGLAKTFLQAEATTVPWPWGDLLNLLLPWIGVATTLLMARFLYLAWPRTSIVSARLKHNLSVPFVLLIAVLLLVPSYSGLGDTQGVWTLSTTMSGLVILAIGGVVAAFGAWVSAKIGRDYVQRLPAGDLVVPVERGIGYVLGLERPALQDLHLRWRRSTAVAKACLGQLAERVERGVAMEFSWVLACMLFLLLIFVFVFVAAVSMHAPDAG